MPIPALASLPNLRQHLAPTVRARLSRGRLQWNVNTERPAQEFTQVKCDPADQTSLATHYRFSSVIRALVAGITLVALIPNLTLGAILWFGVINAPWSNLATDAPKESFGPAAHPAIVSPVLSSPATLVATAGGDIALPITLDGTDGVPARSIIAIRGLPEGSRLSSGRPYDDAEWNVKPDEIGDLHLVVPSTASGDAQLLIQLVSPDGAIIADTATALKMTTNLIANVNYSKTELAQAQIVDEPTEGLGAAGAEESTNPVPVAMPADPVTLPTRRPAQTANDDANSITLTSVNLRERPTRAAPAIGVVEKGTKLHLIERKRGWVRVTNLTTSENGWIYARHITTVR